MLVDLTNEEFNWILGKLSESSQAMVLQYSSAQDPKEKRFYLDALKFGNDFKAKLDALDPRNLDTSQDCDEYGNPLDIE